MPAPLGRYLNLLVDEVRLDGTELHIKDSYGALARAITLSTGGKLVEVPSFVPEWCPQGDEDEHHWVEILTLP